MKKIFVGLLAVIMCVCLFTGCVSPEQTSVAFVVGAHRNFPTLNLNTQDVYDRIYTSAYSYGKLLAVVVDGSPYVYGDYEFKKPDKNIDDSKRKQIARANTNSVIAELMGAKAQTAEVDTLAAIARAARLLKSTGSDKLQMVIYDSGLSTTGILNFAKYNLLDAEAKLVVEQLVRQNALPDLSGISITWYGIGEVNDEQSALTTKNQNNLQTIWGAIIEASGGTVDFKTISLSTVESDSDLPPVSNVTIIQNEIKDDDVIDTPIRLSSVRFVADSARYISEDEAKEALKPLAGILSKNPDKQIVIAGSTASIGTDGKKLSLERADAVKATLISLGVNENQIYATVGLGQTQWSQRVNDLDLNGNLVESAAAKNRAVFVMSADCEEAKEILLLR